MSSGIVAVLGSGRELLQVQLGEFALVNPQRELGVKLSCGIQLEQKSFNALIRYGISNLSGIGTLSAVEAKLKSIFQQNVFKLGQVDVQRQTSIATALKTSQVVGWIFLNALAADGRSTAVINGVLLPRVAARLDPKCLASLFAKIPFV